MKLKTLIIKNIASIEDAVIDFTDDRIARAGMFLICGPTGAGKSTILDAICLALFDTTPRIENSTGELIDIPTEDSKKEKINDVLHLVRKNALSASVTLTFEGKDFEDYTATWRVYRQGLFRNGSVVAKYKNESLEDKLKRNLKKEWSLSDAKGTVFEKDVKNKIIEVIGMDFNQFCKTTMLAQGDFTKFLSCKADEKAAILEKLVGVTQFTKVGMAIFELTAKKKTEMELIERQLESETFLTDEERDERHRQIDTLKLEIDALKVSLKETETKIAWIKDKEKAHSEVLKAQNDYQNATSALNADEVIEHQKMLNLWDMSVDLRQALRSKKACIAEHQNLQDRRSVLRLLFDELLSGLNAMKEDRDGLIAENKVLCSHLESHKPYEAMYENANVIITTNESIKKQIDFISKNTPKLQEYQNKLISLNDRLKEKKELKTKVSAEIADLRIKVKNNRLDVTNFGPDSIDDETADLNFRKHLITEIEYLMRNISEAKSDYEIKAKKVESTKVDIERLEEQSTGTRKALETALKNYESSKTLFEKTKASISDHAKVLRSQLTLGDHCPVCGSIVDEILSDESFINTLKPLEEKFRDDESEVKSATKTNERVLAQIEATKKTLKTDIADLEKTKVRYAKLETDLRSKASVLDIDYDNLSVSLSNVKSVVEKKSEDIVRRQACIRDLNLKYDALNNKINEAINQQTHVIDRDIETIQVSIDDISKHKSALEGQIANAQRSIDTLRDSLRSLIDPNWHPSNQDAYFDELKVAAQTYSLHQRAYSDNLRKIDAIEQNIDTIMSSKDVIVSKFPEWGGIQVDKSMRLVNLTKRWTQLRDDCITLNAATETNESTLCKAQMVIDLFSNEHPEIDINDVLKILDMSNDRIMAVRNLIDRLKDDKSRTESVLQSKLSTLKMFDVSPLSEEETLESLTEIGSTNTQTQHVKAQDIGRIESELANDDKLRAKKGQLKQTLDRLRGEYAEWKVLDGYLGSKDGKRFRNVAQSFILKDLLDKANAYLENITGRYKLFCNPGTLTIMMYDNYQGGVVRPTNTLSGGESFVISLALALGLSSMQSTGFEVDTLFIDEGFGTLSPELLDPVIITLRRLNERYQRRVGIISHVEMLRNHIPVTIEVTRQGKSRSSVKIVSQQA